MNIVHGEVCIDQQGFEIESQGYRVYWDGFLYFDHCLGQIASAQEFCRRVAATGWDAPLRELKGCYFAIVKSPDGVTRAFVDPSGLYSAYVAEHGVGRSFLALASALNLGRRDVSSQSVMEFLQTGNIYFGDTYFPSVRKLSFDEVATIDHAGRVAIQAKRAPQITDRPGDGSFLDSFAGLARALAGQKLSVDITGGFDSRLLVAALLHHGVDFELGLSGFEGHIDVDIGKQVAAVINRPFHLTRHDTTHLSDELESTIRQLDALGGMLTTHHRILQFQRDRAKRGINLSFKGQGGELYKDFFWLQEFPFYNSRHSNVERLHRLRIEMELISEDLFTPAYIEASRAARAARIQRLKQYVLERNTETCDNIYFRERVQTWGCRNLTSGMLPSIKQHSPLCEVQRVQYGFHARRRDRVASFFHRRVIADVSEPLSQILTTDGTSASPRWQNVAADSFGYVRGKAKKLFKKVSQKVFNRTVLANQAPDDTATNQLLSEARLTKQALQALVDLCVLKRPVTLREIPSRFQGNFIVAGWFLGQLRD